MKVYILPSGVEIQPFGEPVRQARIGFETLEEVQRRVFADRGLTAAHVARPEDINDGECFVTYDNVFLSERTFRDFYAQATAGAESAQAALPESLYTRRFAAMQERASGSDARGNRVHKYNLWYLKSLHRPTRARLDGLPPLTVQLKEVALPVAVPRNMFGKTHIEQPITTSVMLHINHWVHVLWANQLAILIRWVEQIVYHPLWTAGRLLLAALLFLRFAVPRFLTTWSLTSCFNLGMLKTAAMRAFNVTGRNCRIHPDAILEFCILGDNVEIGPQSYVQASLLNDGVIVEDKTKIVFSVLDRECYVSQLSVVNSCASYPESDVCIDGMQFCLVGRHAALTGLVRPMDILPRGGNIKVMYKGQPTEIGQEVLGSAFGHRCFIGPDVYIAPGREIPNDAFIVQNAAHVLTKIAPDLRPGEPSFIDHGVLRNHPTRQKGGAS